MNKRILIVRNFASEVNLTSYNLQEVGLGKAFVDKGYDCDIIYYTKDKSSSQIVYELHERKLTIKWTKAIKFMSNSIYPSILRKKLLNKYKLIISTEYNQVMTFLLSILCGEKLCLYHGPYKDNGNKFIQKTYDLVATPIIRKKTSKVFVKSELAKSFLSRKGFENLETIGVGLDIDNLEKNTNENVLQDITRAQGQNLLYVGVLEDRRNIEFLLNVVARCVRQNINRKLILIGNGKEEDVRRYFSVAKSLNIESNIIHIKKLAQSDLKEVYQSADLFLFPTNYDIFGMVLLESMYYKLPIISTLNGGSHTLFNNVEGGVIIDNFNERIWAEKINEILEDNVSRKEMGESAHLRIRNEFNWSFIANKIVG
ncbi:glycosyltransferase family 4 protein [Priestia megaterium]